LLNYAMSLLKYVGNLANKVAKCSQIGTSKRQRGHKKKALVKTQTCGAKPLLVPWVTYMT